MSYYVTFSFSSIPVFLPYSRSYSVQLSFLNFFNVSCHIPGHAVFCLIFHVFFQFSRQNPGTTFYISQYFMYSTVSLQISGPTECASNITHFSVIFAIFHVLACEFLIFLDCQISHHISGPTL